MIDRLKLKFFCVIANKISFHLGLAIHEGGAPKVMPPIDFDEKNINQRKARNNTH